MLVLFLFPSMLCGGIDARRMEDTIRSLQRRACKELEDSPVATLSDPMILHFMSAHAANITYSYGDRSGSAEEFQQLRAQLDTQSILQEMLAVPAAAWLDLLARFFTPRAALFTVIAVPSAATADALAAEEQEVVQKRVAALGEAGLEALGERAEAAQRENDTPIPPALVESVAMPSIGALFYREQCSCEVVEKAVVNVCTCSDQGMMAALKQQATEVANRCGRGGVVKRSGLLYPTKCIQYNTEFASISVILSTQHLTVAEKRLLPILLSCLEECPQRRADGSLRPREEVIDALYRDTVSHSLQLGVQEAEGYSPNRDCEGASLLLEVPGEALERGLELAEDVLVHGEVEAESVHRVLARAAKQLEEQVHGGEAVSMALLRRLMLREESNYNCFDPVRVGRGADE